MRLPCLTLASGLLLASSAASADNIIPSGTWICSGPVCVKEGTLYRHKSVASVDAILHDRGRNKIGKIVKNCSTGVVTAVGIDDMAEDWPIQGTDLAWMCKEKWLPW